MKFSVVTLGCKVNQYETQAMERELCARGHEQVDISSPCDCLIVNTCTVTAVADKKGRSLIRRLRREHPDAVLGVCGCYSQLHPESVRELGADVVSGSGGRQAFLDLLLQTCEDRVRRVQLDEALRRRDFERLPAGGLSERTRAMLKVQDGCSSFCSYCIIPYSRGPVRSLPLSEAVAEARRLREAGYREIVLTGIEIASWGKDLRDERGLVRLVAAVCRAVPEVRVRLGSLEPRCVDEAFCRELSGLSNLCPQFHLSLQSGSDTVLARMRRRYDTARYLESVELLRRFFSGCAITTDLIVAFPGETEEEFRQSLDFLRVCGFAHVHVFPYSRRPGTPAARMDGQHGNAVKRARSEQAVQTAAELSLRFYEQLRGTEQQVLFETAEDGYWSGHAMNSVRVYVRGEIHNNELWRVRVTEPFRDGVLGELLKEEHR